MAEKIEGLSIELDLDTLKIDSGLKDVKSKMSLLTSELKNNMSAFDRGEKSMDKYKTQVDGLNKKLEAQKTVTENARKTYEKAVAAHGEGSVEADKAAAAYNRESASLQNLERYVGKVTDEMKAFQKQQEIQSTTLFKLGDKFTNIGNSLKGFSDKTKELGSSLTKKITLPAIGAASALGGIALVKGFDRLIGIDNAKAKLKGLGHDAEGVEKIMTSALESVKGTSYGMDEAATTAANAVAAGIEPGKELTKYLSLTGDAAAIAGTGLGEMGSILNKVQTSNKAYNGELQQLSDRGLPIYQWLADEAGVAADAVFDLAKEGQISSEMLMNAIENNIGGAAKKMGAESFTASMANMWAAVGRLGASFLDAGGKGGGFFSQLKPLIGDMTERIDTFGGVAEKMGVKFGEAFTAAIDKVKSAKKWFDDLSPPMQDLTKKAALFGSAFAIGIGPVLLGLGTLGGLISKVLLVVGPLMTRIAGMGGILNALKVAFTALTGPVGLTVAAVALLTTGFIALYTRSETFREIVGKVIEKVKELASSAFEKLKEALSAVGSFFAEQGKVLTQFWKENEEVITGALQNIWKVVETVFNAIKKIIEFIMPAVLAIIKSVWGNIKGVITGALDIIMGVVKTFSGLLTGDFSKMWEGVKQIFSGAVTFIWNFVQLSFYGKILGGAKVFIGSFKTFFSGMWTFIKDLFAKTITNIASGVKTGWTGINTVTNTIFTAIFNFLKSIWTTIFNTIKGLVTNLKTTVSNIFEGIRTFVTTATTRARDGVVNAWSKIKSSVVDLAKGLRDKVGGYFEDMVKFAKDLPGKMKDGIISTKNKAVEGIKSLGNSVVGKFGGVINGLIKGINWTTEKLGIKTKIPQWSVPQYARGTGGHPKDGPALVGDGTGRLRGRELITMPNGKSMLSPDTPTMVNLPKGTQVLSAPDTRELFGKVPKYANGTGAVDWVKDKAKGIASVASDVWDYATNPKKLIDLIPLPSLDGIAGGMLPLVKGAAGYVKDKAVDYIKGMFTKAEGEVGAKGPFPSPFRLSSRAGWRIHPIFHTRKFHYGDDWAAPAGTRIPSRSAGRVVANSFHPALGNYVDVQTGPYKFRYQHNSRNLASVGDMVKPGQTLGLVGNTGNSTGPHLHFEIRKNGAFVAPKDMGFASGGFVGKNGMYNLAEEGHGEFIIPTAPKRRTDAMKLLALAAKSITGHGGNKRPNQLPGGSGGGVFEQLLTATLEQNALLMQLLQKDTNLYVDGHELGRTVAPGASQGMHDMTNIKNLVKGLT